MWHLALFKYVTVKLKGRAKHTQMTSGTVPRKVAVGLLLPPAGAAADQYLKLQMTGLQILPGTDLVVVYPHLCIKFPYAAGAHALRD